MDEATSAGRTRLVARVFDDLSDELCRVADMSEFVRLAHPNVNFAAAAEDACITISGLVEQLNTHVGLYEVDISSITIRLPIHVHCANCLFEVHCLKQIVFDFQALARVVNEGDSFPETDVDRHVARLFLLDFLQSGIHLDDEARKMVVRLNDRILQVGQQFAAGAHQGRQQPVLLPFIDIRVICRNLQV